MALTLRQRVNITKGRIITDTSETLMEKCSAALQYIAQNILDGTLDITNSAFVGKGVSQNQLIEWALRTLTGQFDQRMIPMIIDQAVISNLADPTTATDTQIITATRHAVWPYASRIGTGSL